MACYSEENIVITVTIIMLLFIVDKYAYQDLPTLYEYYTEGGIESGLSDNKTYFTLNSKNITILSGSLHYFRVPKVYWRDRLRKLRAAGLNSVETYIPWNLHEHQNGVFDFGNGGSDFEEFLDVAHFLNLAKEEDLFVILRPGPYICAEWEFGGLPSWLLRYKDIKVRTSEKQFMKFASRYLEKLFEIISPLQFTKGGAIIAVQVENEYGNTKYGDQPVDVIYLEQLKNVFLQNGIVELLFTSDTPSNGFYGTIPGVLATANFQNDSIHELTVLKAHQPRKPLMVAEYWTGWYDHWTESHHTRSVEEFGRVLDGILTFGASVNMYMFHGGTNWGFLNGADVNDLSRDNKGFQPVITTYDYNAPLSEAGDYTDKYYRAKDIIARHNKIKIKQPDMPKLTRRIAYPSINITGELSLADLLDQSQGFPMKHVQPMESLPINNGSGQSYGYIIYRTSNIDIPRDSILKIKGRVCDTVLVLLNGKLKSKILESKEDLEGFGYWKKRDAVLSLGGATENAVLELVVENWGRVNYGKLFQFNQHKGLWQGDVLLNNQILEFEKVFPLEFKRSWNSKIKNWVSPKFSSGPKLYKAILKIEHEPHDTYIDTREWNKGFIIVNGFVLGRYLRLGSQQTLYLPAPFLKKGFNDILVFEHFSPSEQLQFSENLIFT
ncbi:unnamed protein product [Phaedon cochleariae]|uniref:Beta-galactosidase n=1 Tax=Phaedon cochleariae TaxID=80249 RepID=A0A9P0DRG8_PHACE|nr:unnamed protein product [Phaedon cochleariae]